MNFLKVGNYLINPALVTEVYRSDEWTQVHYAGSSPTRFKGEEGDVVWRHFTNQAADLMPDTPQDADYASYRKRGGDLARDEWQRKCDQLDAYHQRGESWWRDSVNRDLVMSLESELKL